MWHPFELLLILSWQITFIVLYPFYAPKFHKHALSCVQPILFLFQDLNETDRTKYLMRNWKYGAKGHNTCNGDFPFKTREVIWLVRNAAKSTAFHQKLLGIFIYNNSPLAASSKCLFFFFSILQPHFMQVYMGMRFGTLFHLLLNMTETVRKYNLLHYLTVIFKILHRTFSQPYHENFQIS